MSSINSENSLILSCDELSNIIYKIVIFCIKVYMKLCRKEEYKKKIIQIQILLTTVDSSYKVQIVYCGKINFKIELLFLEAFNDVMKRKNIDPFVLARVCCKNQATGLANEEKKTVIYMGNKIVFTNNKIIKSTIHTYWDEYMCISLKNSLMLEDFRKFEDGMKNFINNLKLENPRVRFVFMKDGHQVMGDSLDVDISSCHAIASAMTTIIANSHDDDFKKTCLDMWFVNHPQELNEKVFKQLIHHLEEVLT